MTNQFVPFWHIYINFVVALLWTAPELLRKSRSFPSEGTKAGDVYSYGIIVQEIVLEDCPYSYELNNKDEEGETTLI